MIRHIVAQRVGMDERAAALPVLRGYLGMDHQRVCVRSLENAVGLAGERVGHGGVGEGELVRRIKMVFMLAWVAARLGEAKVQDHPPAARHMRRYGIEDAPSLPILIEAP